MSYEIFTNRCEAPRRGSRLGAFVPLAVFLVLSDPYKRTGADIDGQVGIDWGVYGVPETLVIDREGRIAYKQIGQVEAIALGKTILPLIRKLRQ